MVKRAGVSLLAAVCALLVSGCADVSTNPVEAPLLDHSPGHGLPAVNGGGKAVVIVSRFLPVGTVTNFSVGARLRGDGTASGHFNCVIPGVVEIAGDVTTGRANEDGSVTFQGFATVNEVGVGIFRDEPFTVTLWEGGPGVGRFLYDDTVVPDPGDLEELITGQILIR